MSFAAAAVLFDLDGVLVDSRHAIATSLNAALTAHGLPPRPHAELHPLIGPPIHTAFRTLAPAVAEATVHELVGAYRADYRAHSAARTTIFAGVPEMLDALAGLPLAVATSKPRALAEPLLDALGLRDRFVAVAGPDLATVDEPKAATIARALTAVDGARPVVMVGDRRYDVEGAHAHGLACIGVLWGIGDERELRAAGADTVVFDPAELPGALAGT